MTRMPRISRCPEGSGASSVVFRLPSPVLVRVFRARARARSGSGLLHVRMEIMKAEREIAHAHAHEDGGRGRRTKDADGGRKTYTNPIYAPFQTRSNIALCSVVEHARAHAGSSEGGVVP